MARTSIGLDIGTRAVRLAEVQVSSGKPVVTRFGRILLPIGAVEHGEVQDPKIVGEAITTLWKRLGLSGRGVNIGVSNRRVVVRVIELPAMKPEDLAQAIRFQAQEHIPIPLEEAILDYEVIEERTTPEGEKFQKILVVAAERDAIAPLLAALQAAKLEPKSVELNAYPLVRAFASGAAGAEAIVDIGAGVTDVVIQHGGKIRFTRILPTFGGDDFTTAIADGLGIDREEAETIKRKASALLAGRVGWSGVPDDDDLDEDIEQAAVGVSPVGVASRPRPSVGRPRPVARGASRATSSSDPIERAASIVEPLVDRIVTEIRGSIDFYASQENAAPVERVILTGGGALMGGVAERLGESLGVPVEQGHPFERVPIGRVKVSSEERAIAEPFIGVAIGLALAGVNQ